MVESKLIYSLKDQKLYSTTEEANPLHGMVEKDGKSEKVEVGKVTHTYKQELTNEGVNNWIKSLKQLIRAGNDQIKKKKDEVKSLQQQVKLHEDRLLEVKRALPKDFVFTEVPDYVPTKEDLSGVKV